MLTKHTLLLGLGAVLFAPLAAAEVPTIGTQCEVMFDFDSAVLSSKAKAELAAVVARSRDHPSLVIVLDGNTDPIGTPAYNVGLSIRRSRAVHSQLITSGIDDSKIIIAAYGEDGARRARFAEDRRVTVWTTREPVGAVIARTFVRGGTAIKWGPPMTTAQIETTTPSDSVIVRR